MDHETEAHIEAARRPPSTAPLKTLAGGLIPSDRYAAERDRRARERVDRQLQALAPVTFVDLPEGRRWCVASRCSGCDGELKLFSDDFTEFMLDDGPGFAGEPNDLAKIVSAGLLRQGTHKATAFKCEPCIKAEEDADTAARYSAELSDRLARAELPRALQGFEFAEMFTNEGRQNAVSAARKWAAEKQMPHKPGLLLFGGRGAGKTRLAATAAWQRLQRWPVKWVSWPILIAQLGAAFNDDARQEALRAITGNGPIVLDDIARDDVAVSDWQKQQLFAAIDRRVQAGAPILVTTNVTRTKAGDGNVASGLGERLGDSIVSRLIGYCTVQELPGNDKRLELNFDGTEPKKS